jgi:hypothetical protein
MAMAKWAKRLIIAGAVLTLVGLASWGRHTERQAALGGMPSQALGGGPVAVELQAICTTPCQLSAVFVHAHSQPDQEEMGERLAVGKHVRKILVPEGTSGKVELLGLSPRAGDTMTLFVLANNEKLYGGKTKLERDLFSDGFLHGAVCEDMPVGAKVGPPACWFILEKFDFSNPPTKEKPADDKKPSSER